MSDLVVRFSDDVAHLWFMFQCPFHGKIIARDEEGQPTVPADVATLMKTETAGDTG